MLRYRTAGARGEGAGRRTQLVGPAEVDHGPQPEIQQRVLGRGRDQVERVRPEERPPPGAAPARRRVPADVAEVPRPGEPKVSDVDKAGVELGAGGHGTTVPRRADRGAARADHGRPGAPSRRGGGRRADRGIATFAAGDGRTLLPLVPPPTAGRSSPERCETGVVSDPIFFASPEALRAWFEANAETEPELILGLRKVPGKGMPAPLSWAQAVDEALCVGWIDGIRRTVEGGYSIRLTPRRAGSTWSAVNVERVRALTAEGRMRPAGLAAFERRDPAKIGDLRVREPPSRPRPRIRGGHPGKPGCMGVLLRPAALVPEHGGLLGHEREAGPDASPAPGAAHRGLGSRPEGRAASPARGVTVRPVAVTISRAALSHYDERPGATWPAGRQAPRGVSASHVAPATPGMTRIQARRPAVMLNLFVILFGLLILVLSVGLGIVLPISRTAAAVSRGRDDRSAAVPRSHLVRGVVGSIVGFAILVIGISGPFVEVPAGNVGVATNFGQVQVGTLQPGLHVIVPIVQQVVNVDTRVQPHQFQEIDAASKELQTVKLTGTMNYHIDGEFASDLYQRVGTDFAAKIIDPAFNDFIKSVVPDYSVNDILAKRDEIRSLAKTPAGRQPDPVPHRRRRHLHRQHRLL